MSQPASSKDFSDHIRQLEMEGNQLVAATNALGNSLCPGACSDSVLNMDEAAEVKRWSPTSLSALADISTEQRTISNLRQQLDAQGRETQRLHRQMYGHNATYRQQSVLSSLEIPIIEGLESLGMNSGKPQSVDCSLSTYSKQFKSNDAAVNELRERLAETIKMSQMQKDQFRQAITDLKLQLQEALDNKEDLHKHKQTELESQQAMIEELQRTVQQLEQANRIQEQAILELKNKLSHQLQSQHSTETAVGNLRQFIADRRSVDAESAAESAADSTTEPALDAGVFALVRSLERKVWDLETQTSRLTEREEQLKAELEAVRNASTDRQNLLIKEHDERLSRKVEDHDRQLNLAEERNTISSQQVTSLHQQLTNLRHDYDHQLQLKAEHISELESTLLTLRQEWADDREQWKAKREAFESAAEQNEKEINAMKMTRLESIRKTAVLESRFEGMQEAISRFERDLDVEKMHSAQLQQQVVEATAREERLAEEARGKNEVIDLLQRDLDTVKRENDSQMKLAMASLERGGEARTSDAVSTLAHQLSTAVERCTTAETVSEVARVEVQRLRSTVEQLQRERDTNAAQRDSLADQLREKTGASHTHEQSLKAEIEDKEKAIVDLKAALDEAQGIGREQAKTIGRLQQERDDLSHSVDTRAAECDRLRRSCEDTSRTLELRERYAQETSTEAERLAALLETATNERQHLLVELEESRREVSALREARGVGTAEAGAREGYLQAQLEKYKQRLKASQADLNLANNTLKTRELMGGKAVKAAGRMQKEVTEKRSHIDTLQCKLRWCEQNIEAARKDKLAAQEESAQLMELKTKANKQNEKLAEQVHKHQVEAQELKVKVKQLESSLERAAVKHAATCAKLEQCDQDMTRLKLKHQLELKEMERNNQINRQQVVAPLQRAAELKARNSVAVSQHLQPVSIHETPVCEKSEPYQRDAAFGDELRQLAGEMRSLLQQTQLPSNQRETSGKVSSHGYHSAANSEHETTSNKNNYLSQLVERYLRLTKDYSENDDTVLTPSRDVSAERLVKSPFPPADGSTSPVSGLLANRDDRSAVSSASSRRLNNKKKSGHNAKIEDKQRHLKAALCTDTRALCERLEKKIENLGLAGGRLQGDNKELMKLLQNQDKKLKKVKVQISK